MKKLVLSIVFSLFAVLSLFANKAWTVENVPNTRLQSGYIHVSDPDGFLSDDVEMHINTALCAIRQECDVFLVTLSSIGYEDPKDFASRLLNHWGVGDKGKDNGLMLLFVEDQHAFEFETGYGIEAVLTDMKCFEIFNNTIKPYFKKGDYEGGMYAGVLDIVDVFGGTVPEQLVTVLPDPEVYKTAIAEKEKRTQSVLHSLVAVVFVFIIFISFFYFLYTFAKYIKNRRKGIKWEACEIVENDGLKYINTTKHPWSGSAWMGTGFSRFIHFGLSGLFFLALSYAIVGKIMPETDILVVKDISAVLSVLLYLTYICVKHNLRTLKVADKMAAISLEPYEVYKNAAGYRRTKFVNFMAPWIGWYFKKIYEKRQDKAPLKACPECRKDLLPDETMVPLPEKEAKEVFYQAKNYTSYHCADGHHYIVGENGKMYTSFVTCVNCNAHLAKLVKSNVLKKPTYSRTGLNENEYECEFCKSTFKRNAEIPKLVPKAGSSSGYSSGYSGGYSGRSGYSGSSRSSGGSFGGGRSGGGGYSGRW